MRDQTMIIVGAGQAGGRAALTLRDAGHQGRVILLGSEATPPYERPPLSKDYLKGERDRQSFCLATRDQLEKAGIDFRPETSCAAIDPAAKKVTLGNGEELGYGKLLLATGRAPRRLPSALADGLDGRVHLLRDLDDCDGLGRALRSGRHIVIIGGGFIGLEVAATARSLGVEVTVVELMPRLLSRAVPEPLAERLETRHRDAGVAFRLGRKVETLASVGDGVAVVLDDGERFVADAVLVGIGALPRTSLAEAAGLAVDRGILVDAQLRTSDPDIFAAGDVAAFIDPRTKRRERLESWHNAELQGVLAARNMAGAEEAYAALPWFWSDQYELTLQMAGHPDLAVRTIERPAGDDARLLFHQAADGRIVGVSALGPASLAKEFKLAQHLAEAAAAPDPALLADPKCRLKTLLR